LKKDKERLEELLELRDKEITDMKAKVDKFDSTFLKEKKVLEEKLSK
jgi:hypothetical protein